ncbi:hypothetical protein [Actinosynnema sp. NPDC020468]|uniref:hypothetical protein n=1 Tax=Actinosynnema sp. NPDC020468 TaxID=3154488 RepID=UPI0033FEA795
MTSRAPRHSAHEREGAAHSTAAQRREITYYKHCVEPYDTASAAAILVGTIEEITEAEGRAGEAERRGLATPPRPPAAT